jgi:glycosyltransferase involved in cell wall biosynthesis
MKLILISPKNRTAYNFRGDLIREIVADGGEVVVTGPDRTDVDKITELGARFVEIPMNKNGLNPMADLAYQKALTRLFRAERPDVVLGYTAKPVIYGTLAAHKAGVPHKVAMVTGAGYAFTARTAKARVIKVIMSMLYKRAFRRADTVIFQNSDDLTQFVGEGLVSQKKCRIVDGSGVNTERFPMVPYPERMTFFMLSRVMYSKGIREYLEACSLVKKLHPEVRFMLLGACEGIQDSISKEDLKPYIEQGILEHFGETDRVADYYAQCSVYVLPSYREGTPRTVLEAMSMGRPVITTDAPGCRETVTDGVNGYLVPIKDVDAIVTAMERILDDSEATERMTGEARRICEERYDVRKVNRTIRQTMGIGE